MTIGFINSGVHVKFIIQCDAIADAQRIINYICKELFLIYSWLYVWKHSKSHCRKSVSSIKKTKIKKSLSKQNYNISFWQRIVKNKSCTVIKVVKNKWCIVELWDKKLFIIDLTEGKHVKMNANLTTFRKERRRIWNLRMNTATIADFIDDWCTKLCRVTLERRSIDDC